jgi:hypothetical protein
VTLYSNGDLLRTTAIRTSTTERPSYTGTAHILRVLCPDAKACWRQERHLEHERWLRWSEWIMEVKKEPRVISKMKMLGRP